MIMPRSRPLSLPIASASLLLAAGLAAPALAQYTAEPLGTLGGSFGSAAQAISDNSEVVGWSETAGGEIHAFCWANGVMADLGTLPGHVESAAFGINSSSVIVGYSADANGVETAVRWDLVAGQWQITPLGALPGGAWSIAWDINDAGAIVGVSNTGAVYHAFLLPPAGSMTDLGTPGFPEIGSYSEALGINGTGHVVGYAYRPLWGPDHAWYFDGATATDITPPGQFIFARGTSINAGNTAAGILIQPGGGSDGFEAATWSPGQGWTELGVLPGTTESEAWGINDAGAVVGRSFDIALDDYRGFVFLPGTGMIDLSMTKGAAVTEAVDINNAGVIVATAVTMAGPVTYILTPQAGGCYANCDNSTSAPILNVADFGCFLQKFAAGDLYANCDNSTGSPVLNVADFGCFLQKFAAGCE